MAVIHTMSIDWATLVFGILLTLILVCILSFIFVKLVKHGDSNKPLVTKKVVILEKKLSQGNIEWYNIETSDNERLQLRNFNANKIIITAGDHGILSYRGKTIVAFERSVK